jgi:hypothetical protein
MRLSKASDWYKIREELVRDYSGFVIVNDRRMYTGLAKEQYTIIKNMDKMVDNISRLEPLVKKGMRRNYDKAIIEFNEHLELMEQFFLMNKLMNG